MPLTNTEGGELYTVPFGLTVHCVRCSVKLEPGDECYIEGDSSSIYCPNHIPRPKRTMVLPVPEPQPLWMAYE